MKLKSKLLLVFLAGVIAITSAFSFASLDSEVFIQSQESKTMNGGPVFNQIKWFSNSSQDIFMMNQSHHGSQAATETWDRLAIVIDKTKTPHTAQFYQFEPGPLIWSETLPQKKFKVSCFLCHNNGPRAIRANFESPFDPSSFGDSFKIFAFNLKLKWGGLIKPNEENEKRGTLLVPFRYSGTYENETLKVATCTHCHQDSGIFARGFLHRQQSATIRSMLERGQMPPLGFKLSAKEKQELENF